jgi:hypothetical protein
MSEVSFPRVLVISSKYTTVLGPGRARIPTALATTKRVPLLGGGAQRADRSRGTRAGTGLRQVGSNDVGLRPRLSGSYEVEGDVGC